MVRVCWDRTTGALQSVSAADGPGQHTDDADVETVEDILQSASTIDERTIAEAVMKAYDGELQNYPCHVTADTCTRTSEQPVVATTIAFVEIQDEEDKQNQFNCDACDSNMGTSKEWEFRVRDEGGWIYHDWCCPACGEIVNTDLVEMPESQNRARYINGLS